MIAQKHKLYLTDSQKKTLSDYIGICKKLWNICLEQREDYWHKANVVGPETYKKEYKYISEYGQSAELTQLKKTEGFEYLYTVPAGTLAKVLNWVDLAYAAFFKAQKEAKKKKIKSTVGKPRYKRRKDRMGLVFKNSKKYEILPLVGSNYARVRLDKIGTVRFRYHKEVLGKVKYCTVIEEADGWYICFTVDYVRPAAPENPEFRAIGLDLGVARTIATSGEEFFDLPESIGEKEKRIQVLQRRLRNKKRGSKNLKKAWSQIAKLKLKIAREKDYWIKHTVHQLVMSYSLIAIEDLKIKNMVRSAKGTIENPGTNVKAKTGLNRSILKNNWGAIIQQLEEKCAQHNRKLIKINPKNTSRKCSSCGFIDKENRLTQAQFICMECNYTLNADVNAARNILHLALTGEGSVEMSALAESMKQKYKTKKAGNERKYGGLSVVPTEAPAFVG